MTQNDGLCDTSISLTVESLTGMGWAQLGKQCSGCVSSTQPKQTGPFPAPACGTIGVYGWLVHAILIAGHQKGYFLVLRLWGSAAASPGSLGRRAGESEPRNGAEPQGTVSLHPPPALRCGPRRAEARRLLHRWWMDALRSMFTSVRKGDHVCQHLDHHPALCQLQE